MKRVLVIAYFFPPLANSGTQRPTKFVRYLPEFGWEPVVIAGKGAYDDRVEPQLLRELRPDLIVRRVPMLSERASGAVATVLGRRAGNAVEWRLRSLLARPDLYGAWRHPATVAAKRLASEFHCEAVLATGFPWTSLVVGRDVSRSVSLPFLADFRDPWMGDDVYREPGSRDDHDLRIEQSIVREASAVISVSDVMSEGMRMLHASEDPEKFQTIWNGYDRDDITMLDSYPPPNPGKFRVVYAGVWKPMYGPSLLYTAVSRLAAERPEAIRNLEVVAIGFPPGHAESLGIGSYVTELGPLSHASALGVMASADALYAPVPLGSYHRLALPGKLFEYLGLGRPIFATTAEDGETARMLRRVGGGRVLESDERLVMDLLVEMCQIGKLRVSAIDADELARLDRRNLTARLAATLDRVTRDRRGRTDPVA